MEPQSGNISCMNRPDQTWPPSWVFLSMLCGVPPILLHSSTKYVTDTLKTSSRHPSDTLQTFSRQPPSTSCIPSKPLDTVTLIQGNISKFKVIWCGCRRIWGQGCAGYVVDFTLIKPLRAACKKKTCKMSKFQNSLSGPSVAILLCIYWYCQILYNIVKYQPILSHFVRYCQLF